MVTADDIAAVDVQPGMLTAGVQYAERSLHFTFNRMGLADPYKRVGNIIAGIVMEEAFRHLLDTHGVKYDLLGRTHFTQKDRYDAGIAGNRYDVKGFVVKDRERLEAIRASGPAWFLDCSALVPADQVEARSLRPEDLYVFPFATSPPENIGAIGRIEHWLHCFWDYDWFKNKEWKSLGRMRVQSRMPIPVHVRVGGQNEEENFISEDLELLPNRRGSTSAEFHTALFLHCAEVPVGDLVVSCENRAFQATIPQTSWSNVWPNLDRVYFTGLIPKGEFKEKSTEIPRFYKKCKQYGETKTTNRMLLVKHLHPVERVLTLRGSKA